MYRLFVLAGMLALTVFVSCSVQAEDKDGDKPKSIGEIMKKAHAGDKAFKAAITKALKAKDFEEAGTTMKAWGALAPQLGSFDPPEGDKASWKKLTKKYATDVKALSKAIEDKDGKAAGKALKAINSSCGACHKVHKGG
jgi:cytochrome c556